MFCQHSSVKPGVRFREIGEVINRHASMAGFSVVKSYCGHGIGELFHCAPNIPHYARNKAVGVMKAGQIYTIEPMINAGVWRDRMWPDGWTSVTADGKRSAQFEHTLLDSQFPCSFESFAISDRNGCRSSHSALAFIPQCVSLAKFITSGSKFWWELKTGPDSASNFYTISDIAKRYASVPFLHCCICNLLILEILVSHFICDKVLN
ncbi:hypothetical protein RHGRI_019240 [Rhododendron griersonianum]|uniref:Peptidase M24 domain-containing protein n=1 Tax=Rhododendron griersonianum TaxID=479676 RepID=A0AAV6JEP7_9ERIC|nr:hypothetical protein RHGRI_019240 [Rhododendron griersonianum]